LETEEVQDFVEQIAQIENTVFNLEEKNLLDNAIGTVMQPFYEEPPQPTAQ
jgi:hypothetical protein